MVLVLMLVGMVDLCIFVGLQLGKKLWFKGCGMLGMLLGDQLVELLICMLLVEDDKQCKVYEVLYKYFVDYNLCG